MSTLSRRDRMIPWYFVMFFAFIAIVDGIMVTLAVRTHTGLVTDHAYEKGLAYNQIVQAADAQAQLGWKSEIALEGNTVYFRLRDAQSQPLAWEQATATISRPTQAGMDFTVDLRPDGSAISFPLKGLWEVRVDASHRGVHYQQTKRIVVE